MKTILVIGAGRSASSLIRHLQQSTQQQGFKLVVMDREKDLMERKTRENGSVADLELAVGNALDASFRAPYMERADIIISMLPAHLHLEIVKDAIALGKHVITPSYISKEIQALDEEAKKKGVLVLGEMGLDPGLDHMSAMQILERIKSEGNEMDAFESFCGGLVAPEFDTNPWKYKFTWNPRNVVLAGSGGAVKFIQEGKYKFIPYHKVFRRTETIEIPGYGMFEGYANRDSLGYRSAYGLDGIPTIFRGTLRRPGFCKAWDLFVQLGATDDSYTLEDSENMTHREFINSFLAYSPTDSVELKFKYHLGLAQDDSRYEKVKWLGVFSEEKIGLANATPAQVLQHILEKKWSLDPADRDMIVMWHKFVFQKDGEFREVHSSMVLEGEVGDHTAMSMTVGLPLAVAALRILQKPFEITGVHLPIHKEIYDPVLAELENYGIRFEEREVEAKLYRRGEI